MPKSKDWIRLLKIKAFEDKATNLKINNIKIDEVNFKVKRELKCMFKCFCGEIGCKNIRECVEKCGLFCRKCSENIRSNNIKNTKNNHTQEQKNLTNQKRKNTIKKLNEENPNRQNEIDKKKQIAKKITEKKLNEEDPNRHNRIIETQKNTVKEKNKKYPNRQNEITKKKINTLIKRYGVRHNMHVPEFFNKSIKNSFKLKHYKLPSGKTTQVQGYEPIALDELFENNYKEDDIITQYQGIEYEFENNTHKYYADIYIKSENKIIEVKSDFTMEKEYDKNMAKWEACVDLGYEFEFWIYDGKKNKEVLKL